MSKRDQQRSPHATAIRTLRHELPPMVVILGVLVAVVLFFSKDVFMLNLLAMAFLFGGLATAWNIIGGFGGQFSIGHSVFFAFGAYVTANLFLKLGLSPWFGMFPAAIASAAIAALVSWPVFRLRGPFFAIATMALTEVALALAVYLEQFTGGASGISIPFRLSLYNMQFSERISYSWLMLGYLWLCILAALLINRSRLGYYLQAVRDNESAAIACGICTLRTKTLGMAMSAGLTGVGGSLFIMYVRVADPMALLSLFDIGVKIVLIALIGGVGTIYGPMLGALFVVMLESWLRATLGAQLPGTHLIVLGLILVLSARFMKTGIVGRFVRIMQLIREKRA